MIGGILIMGGLGVVVGVGLALASKIFHVDVDPKIEAVGEALPGANCGGCGLPGCGANAVAIVAGKASPSSCVAGGPEIALEIATIMGVALEAKEPDFAKPGCTYGVQDADVKYLYDGINDCRAAALLDGGSKVCPIGCLGLGTCVRACPFDALSMGPDGLPVVDENRCTGCGTCERICPKNIITLTSNSRRIQNEYTTDECTAPCQRACPAGIDIPAYIRRISEGNYTEAVRIIKETNPLPLICGRICVHPCELECRRNLVDESVAINHLKRFAADYEMKSGQRVQIPRAPETGHRVAVVGGGAEGMTAAYFLNRVGHDPSVYEATSRLGGLLWTGLPENRLPRDVLEWEMKGILEAGVQAKTGRRLGADFTIDSLLGEGFKAVLVTIGGWDTRISEGLQGQAAETLPGLRLLIDFIMAKRAGQAPSVEKNVMILGGGCAGLEAASTCIREGAESVSLVFRGSREEAALALSEEAIEKAEQEGIRLYFNRALTKMTGEGPRLTGVEVTRINGPGRTPEALPVDLLLTGAGRFPELIYVPVNAGKEADSAESLGAKGWETLVPYPGPSAREELGIFRPGEVTGDYKAVVEAIGSGRRAANSAHRFLTGRAVEAPGNMIRTFTRVLSLDEVEQVSGAPRQEMPQLTEQEQIAAPSGEINLGYSEDQALTEAKRCLKCGLICYRRVRRTLH
ncbi:MAG: FAD-dependent oxidoreductase [Pseudomonadota bacterium]